MVLWLGSILFRFMPEPERKNFQNLDATLHALFTIEAMAETPISTHKLLPIVTFGNQRDKFVGWGGAKFDSKGNGIYTSFPPLGFAVPYLAFKAFGLPPSINSLFLFNVLIQCASVFLAFNLARSVCSYIKIRHRSINVAAFIATLPYIFSTEALYSHGYAYWGQSLFQVFFLLFLSVIVRQAFSGKPVSFSQGAATSACVALMCLTEWSGFLAAAGVPVAFYFVRNIPLATRRTLSLIVIGSAAVAGMLLIAWFASSVGLDVLRDALQNRFAARGVTSSAPLSALLSGYLSSFGLFLVLIPAGMALMLRARRDRRLEMPVFILVVVLAAVFENIMMKQHATEYHYDRLKVLLLFTVTVPFLWLIPVRSIKVATLALALFASGASIATYRTDRFYEDIDADSNSAYVRAVDTSDGIVATENQVRGYTALMFRQNVHEGVRFNEAPLLAAANNKPVYWVDSDALQNLVLHVKGIFRVGVGGDIKHYSQIMCSEKIPSLAMLSVKGCVRAGELYVRDFVAYTPPALNELDLADDALQPFDLTNESWLGGVGRESMGAVFFVKATKLSRDVYLGHVRELSIHFADGQKRKVLTVRDTGEFLNIFVEGPPLNGAKVGRPQRIEVQTEFGQT